MKVVFGRGTEVGVSALIGPGRVGLIVITPSRPDSGDDCPDPKELNIQSSARVV